MIRTHMHYKKPSFVEEIIAFLKVMYTLHVAKRKITLDDSCVLVVMDAITAYEPLFTRPVLREMWRTLEIARGVNCKIVLTRWVRHRQPPDSDEIDRKGHWSFYVPKDGIDLLVRVDPSDVIVDVRHTNAFAHEEFCSQIPPDKTIVFMGCWAESCIINTVRAALDRNMKTKVIMNASTGHFGAFGYAMYLMQLIYTDVVSSVTGYVKG